MDTVDKNDLEALKKGMFDIMNDIGTSFKWFPTFEKGYVLFYVETVEGEELFHSWFEVKNQKLQKIQLRTGRMVFSLQGNFLKILPLEYTLVK